MCKLFGKNYNLSNNLLSLCKDLIKQDENLKKINKYND